MLGEILTPQQVYQYALNAGFSDKVAEQMVAIAMRESNGNTLAMNPGTLKNPEYSLGLWQINMDGSLGTSRLNQCGLTSVTDLIDPQTNANCAYQIYQQSGGNLDTAWYTDRPGYKEAFQSWLDKIKGTLFPSSNDLNPNPSLVSSDYLGSFDLSSWQSSTDSSLVNSANLGLGILLIGGMVLIGSKILRNA